MPLDAAFRYSSNPTPVCSELSSSFTSPKNNIHPSACNKALVFQGAT
jgi:hypothetical protein